MLFGSILRELGDTYTVLTDEVNRSHPSTQQGKNNIQKPPKRTISIYIYIYECDVHRWKLTSFCFPELEYTNRIALASSPAISSDTFVCVSIHFCLLLKWKEDQKKKKWKEENFRVKEQRK